MVVGATGRVGGAAVERLLEAGFEVRALVRRPEKGDRLRSLGTELAVGDATAPDTLGPAVRGCSGIFSALGAGPGRGSPEDVEYRGNMNLLSAARSAGVERFVYSSVLMADNPLAQRVGAFREKARFEQELLAAEDVSSTILRPAILGTWIGGFAYSNLAATIFLAIGAGAILQVIYEVARLLLKDSADNKTPALSAPNLGGLTTGVAIMYATALLVSV